MILKRLSLGNGIALLVTFLTLATPANTHNDGVRMGFIAGMNSKYFLIDPDGKVLKELNCIYASPFSEGLALIRKPSAPNTLGAMMNIPTGDENSVFIDVNGNEIKSPEFKRANPFHEGITWAEASTFNHFLMDKTGKLLTKVNDDWIVDDFSEGLAPVWLQREEMRNLYIDPTLLSNRWGFINTAGKVVIPFELSYANGFHEGAASVRDKKGLWFLIDKTGKQLGDKYDDVDSVSDGMAKFKSGTKYGYLNYLGNQVLQAQYIEARDFAEGLAAVKVGDKFGFIDKSGKEKISPQFLDSLKFSDGLCPVQTSEKKWGFIDQNGKLVIQATFDEALPFSGGRALVQVAESIAFIDKTGKFIIAPKYDTASSFRNDRTIVTLGSPEERNKTKARMEEWKREEEAKKAKGNSAEIATPPKATFLELSNGKGTQTTLACGLSPDEKYFLEKISVTFTKTGHPTEKLILSRRSDEERLQEYSADFDATPIKNNYFNSTYINDYSWAPDSKNFVYAAADNLFFCNVETKERIKWQDRHLKSYNLCQYSPDGRFIAVGGAQGDKWNSIHELMILDAKTRKIVFHPDIYSVACIAWTPDSSKIAVRFGPQCLKILDVKNSFAPLNLIQKEFGEIVYSPDAKYIASSRFNQIDIFDTNGNLIEEHPLNQVGNITWTADSKQILYTTDLLWNKTCSTLKLNLQPIAQTAPLASKPSTSSNEQFITTLPKFGVMDLKQHVLIPFEYFSIQPTSNNDFRAGSFDKANPGMSPSSIALIDKSGNIKNITTPKGLLAVQPAGQVLVVKKDENVYPEIKGKEIFGLCDLHGNIIVEPNYEDIAYADEKCILLTSRNQTLDIFNYKGVKTGSIPKEFYLAYSPTRSKKLQLSEGLIPVRSTDFQANGFCDMQGKVVGKTSGHTTNFSEGLAALSFYKKPTQFMDKSGKILFETDLECWSGFRGGFCVGCNSQRKFGVIDKTGKIILEFQFDWLNNLKENLFAKYTANGKDWDSLEIIDSIGNVAFKLPAGTSYISEFNEGLAPFCINGPTGRSAPDRGSGVLWGYIDKTGKVVVEPKYMEASPFENGYAQVKLQQNNKSARAGLIDKQGKLVIQPEYDSLKALPDGIVIAAKPSTVNFSPLDWKSATRNFGTDKKQLFYGLLKDYDLIGMPKTKLVELLGMPKHPNDSIEEDFLAYSLKATGCINEHVWFAVKFENGKVKSWRVSQGMFGTNDGWITENVVYEDFPSEADEHKNILSPTNGRKAIPKNSEKTIRNGN